MLHKTEQQDPGGMLILYISKEYTYSIILKKIVENFNLILGIEIKIGEEYFQIITIYHPPQTKDIFIEYLEKLIENIEFNGNLKIISGRFDKNIERSRKNKLFENKHNFFTLTNKGKSNSSNCLGARVLPSTRDLVRVVLQKVNFISCK